MDVRRTVPVALDVDSDDAALLEDTVDTFLWSAQYVSKFSRMYCPLRFDCRVDHLLRCHRVCDTYTVVGIGGVVGHVFISVSRVRPRHRGHLSHAN